MSRGPLPLAFLLAMAADTANAGTFPVAEGAALRPGALSGLLPRDLQPTSPSPEQRTHEGQVGTQLVQFFPNFPNFRNCFVGSWRNC